MITRTGGTFDCSLRLGQGSYGKGWVLGIGRYSGERLEWYRVFSYATRPRRVFSRRDLHVVERRDPHGAEVFSLLSGAVVVRCLDADGPVELAMSHDTLTGFLVLGRVVAPRHRRRPSCADSAVAAGDPQDVADLAVGVAGPARTAGPRAG